MSTTVSARDLHAGDWIWRESDSKQVWITRRRVDGDTITLGTGRGLKDGHVELTVSLDTPMQLLARWPEHPPRFHP